MADESTNVNAGSNQSAPQAAASGVVSVIESVAGSFLPSDEKFQAFLDAARDLAEHTFHQWLTAGEAKIQEYYRSKVKREG